MVRMVSVANLGIQAREKGVRFKTELIIWKIIKTGKVESYIHRLDYLSWRFQKEGRHMGKTGQVGLKIKGIPIDL